MIRALSLALLALPAPAFAHAFLQSASPAVGATVSTAPKQLTLHFTEAVEPLFSQVTITGPAGQPIGTGKLRQGPTGADLILALSPAGPGRYHVAWHATSRDTHKTEGTFTFTVK